MGTAPTEVSEFVAQGRTIAASGELICGLSATALPSHTGNVLVLIRSLSTNVGIVYVGASTVTAADASTDTTTGIELSSELYLPLADSSDISLIGTDAADGVTYLILR